MKTIPVDKSFSCHMNSAWETNFFDCREECMYFQGNTSTNEKNPWWGCSYEEDPYIPKSRKELFEMDKFGFI